MQQHAMHLGIDIRRAAVAAIIVERARRNHAFQPLDRYEGGARSGRQVSIWAPDMALHRLLEHGRLPIAPETSAINALPRLPGQLLRFCALRKRRHSSPGKERGAFSEKLPPVGRTVLALALHIAPPLIAPLGDLGARRELV